MKNLFAASLAACTISAVASPPNHQAHMHHSSDTSPYVEMQSREIKALAPQQIEDLRAGKGMGLSLPAELNGAPGPLHALELGDKLGLTEEQRVKLEEIVRTMRTEAVVLGEKIIAAERVLDANFKDGQIDEAKIDAQSLRIAKLNGELRAVHLKAHLRTASALSPRQIAAYKQARGYAADQGNIAQ